MSARVLPALLLLVLLCTGSSLSSDEYITEAGVSHLAGVADDNSQPHIVLLAPAAHTVIRDTVGGDRVKRDAAGSTPGSTATATTTSEPTSQRRGYQQNEEDFLKDADITEDNINNKIQNHNLSISNDTHKYYKFEFHNSTSLFIDLDEKNKTGDHKGKVQEHSMLSQSYRRAATINLKFSFPFYGHEVDNITIATGGFLYTGDYVHSWLAATQYIAPLMANFDTSNNHNAKIRYLDTGSFLVVEWRDVYLQERESEGPFTFQVILWANGDIEFAYESIPLAITTIQDEEHPVKVGLSDAYIIDRTIFFVRRKTIYEYHRVNLKSENITSHTGIRFLALDTCNRHKNCTACLAVRPGSPTGLECRWCPELMRCSDGMDRNRQEWLMQGCDKNNISRQDVCHEDGDRPYIESTKVPPSPSPGQAARSADSPTIQYTGGAAVSPGGLATLIILVCLVVTLVGWTGYAYFYPHTWSGQLLIKYRPSSWRWRQGGARYTAASIHM